MENEFTATDPFLFESYKGWPIFDIDLNDKPVVEDVHTVDPEFVLGDEGPVYERN